MISTGDWLGIDFTFDSQALSDKFCHLQSMAYVPPHKRLSKTQDETPPTPTQLLPKLKSFNLNSSKRSSDNRTGNTFSHGKYILYAKHSISRWLAVQLMDDVQVSSALCLVPVCLEFNGTENWRETTDLGYWPLTTRFLSRTLQITVHTLVSIRCLDVMFSSWKKKNHGGFCGAKSNLPLHAFRAPWHQELSLGTYVGVSCWNYTWRSAISFSEYKNWTAGSKFGRN